MCIRDRDNIEGQGIACMNVGDEWDRKLDGSVILTILPRAYVFGRLDCLALGIRLEIIEHLERCNKPGTRSYCYDMYTCGAASAGMEYLDVMPTRYVPAVKAAVERCDLTRVCDQLEDDEVAVANCMVAKDPAGYVVRFRASRRRR